MDGAVLADDGAAVDADNIAAREGCGDELQGLCVEVGLAIGRAEHGTVDDEEVGIGGWKTLSVIIDCAWHRQAEQAVGLAVERAQGVELLLHQLQLVVLLVAGVVARDI